MPLVTNLNFSAPSTVTAYYSDASIVAGDAVYIDSDGYARKVDASDDAKVNFVGFALGAGGASLNIQTGGDLDIRSGHTLIENAVDGGKFNNAVRCTAKQSDGKILVGGTFSNYGGVTGRNYIIRLNADGTVDTNFCVNASDGKLVNGNIVSIKIQTDGKILVAGFIPAYGGVSGRKNFLRLNPDGTLDTDFCSNAVDGNKFGLSTMCVAIQSDQKILIGGEFTGYGGVAGRNYLVRLNSDGTLDTSFCSAAVDNAKLNYAVSSVAVQPLDQKILVGGGFYNYGMVQGRDRLIRLNSNGTIDNNFCLAGVDNYFGEGGPVNAICLQSDGKILVGGNFTNYGQSILSIPSVNRFIRLESSGSPDTDFIWQASSGAFSDEVTAIDCDSNGKIIVGGFFIDYNGLPSRSYLVRFDSYGNVDESFGHDGVDGKFNYFVYSVEESDGKILVGGGFTDYDGVSGRSCLISLKHTGLPDIVNFTKGKLLYIDPFTPGALTETKPKTYGKWIIPVAISTNSFTIAINGGGGSAAEKVRQIVVGSLSEVDAGAATHATISDAISAASSGQKIKVLSGVFTENLTIDKSVFIEGDGYQSELNGSLTFTSTSDFSKVSNLRLKNSITFNSGSDGNFLVDCWKNTLKTTGTTTNGTPYVTQIPSSDYSLATNGLVVTGSAISSNTTVLNSFNNAYIFTVPALTASTSEAFAVQSASVVGKSNGGSNVLVLNSGQSATINAIPIGSYVCGSTILANVTVTAKDPVAGTLTLSSSAGTSPLNTTFYIAGPVRYTPFITIFSGTALSCTGSSAPAASGSLLRITSANITTLISYTATQTNVIQLSSNATSSTTAQEIILEHPLTNNGSGNYILLIKEK